MIVVKHGRREMQLAWTHLLPATFSGRARMNVQNSLAAAAAAFAAGAPLHDIRQGLRTFSTNYYLSPGRLNEVEVNGVNVIVDYCHNAPGHEDARRLRGPRRRLAGRPRTTWRGPRGSASSPPPATGATRTCASSAQVAAQHFDVVIVREDVALRGRERGDVAELVAEGVRAAMAEGARCKQVEMVPRRDRGRAPRDDPRQPRRPRRASASTSTPTVMAELETWSDAGPGRLGRQRRGRRRPGHYPVRGGPDGAVARLVRLSVGPTSIPGS